MPAFDYGVRAKSLVGQDQSKCHHSQHFRQECLNTRACFEAWRASFFCTVDTTESISREIGQ